MGYLCDDCNLKDKIDIYREKLHNMILQKNNDLLDKEIIQLSQDLDKLVYTYYYCRDNRLN